MQSCTNALARANELTFVPLDGIDDYRRFLIEEIEDTCDYYRIKMRGFATPSVLREYRRAAACTPFVDAMEGKTDTATFIRSTAAESCKMNGSPSTCVQRALDMDPRVYLLEYGWHNCALQYVVSSREGEAQREQMRAQLEKQFRRLFKLGQDKCRIVNPG
jgi:hypothetical protein